MRSTVKSSLSYGPCPFFLIAAHPDPPEYMAFFSRLRQVGRFLLACLHLSMRTTLRLIFFLLVLAGLLLATVQFWFLPHLNDYRQQLAQELSLQIGRPVLIGQVRGEWRSGHLLFNLSGFQINDQKGAAALSVAHAQGELSWWSLLRFDLIFRTLDLQGAVLRLGKDAEGHLWLGDLPLKQGRGDQNALPNWLLRQKEWSLNSGVMWWQDAKNPGAVLKLEQMRAHYERGFFEHEFSAAAQPMWGGSRPWSVKAKWTGNKVENWSQWRGEMALQQPSTPIQQLWPWLGLPSALAQGQLASALRLKFERGQLTKSQLDFDARDLLVTLAKEQPAVALAHLNGKLNLQAWQERGYELKIPQVSFKLPDSAPYALKNWRFAYLPAQGKQLAKAEAEVSEFDLQLLPVLARFVPLPAEQKSNLESLNSSGNLKSLLYQWQGPLDAPAKYQLKLGLDKATWQAPAPWPSVRGLSADVSMDQQQGQLDIHSTQLQLLLPLVFEHALDDLSVKAKLSWQGPSQKRAFRLEHLALSNHDVKAEFKGRYQQQEGRSAFIDLSGDLGPVQAKSVAAYLPKQLDPITTDWLKHAFLAGVVPKTRFELRGDLQDFPFAGNKNGLFRVASELQDVKLLYGPGWPTVDQIHGKMVFEGRRMDITATSASILGTQVKSAKVAIPELDNLDPQLTVEGQVEGATRDFLSFLALSPLDDSLGEIARALDVEGRGALTLGLQIPLQHVVDTKVKGRYLFADNTIKARDAIPRFEKVTGDLSFNEQSASMRQGHGLGLGGEALVNVHPDAKGNGIEVEINGRADVRKAAAFYELPLQERVSGNTDYRLLLSSRPEGLAAQLQTNLEGVALNLPAPLGKTAADGRSLRLELIPLRNNKEQWVINYQKGLGANLIFTPGLKETLLERGQINLGSQNTPKVDRPGLWLGGHMPVLRWSEWQPLLGEGGNHNAIAVDGLNLTVEAFEWQSRRWPTLSVDVKRNQQRWTGHVSSPLGQGDIVADFSGDGRIEANLKHLTWPDPKVEPAVVVVAPAAETVSWNPASWPTLVLNVEHLYRAGRDLGLLKVKGNPLATGYQLDELQLSNSDGDLSGQLSWQKSNADLVGKAHVALNAKDMGQWLNRWGQGDLLRRGSGSFNADFNWSDPDLLPTMAGLNGAWYLEGEKGVLLKVNPGLGRLLGLLNLESILRRAQLDFRDVFNEGLSFDKIACSAKIAHGIMILDNFHMVSPAVGISMDGQANLVTEALNLRLRVVPSVSSGVAVAAGTLVNPVVGLSIYLLQQVLSNPVGKILTYTYFIGGRWSQPEVKTVEPETPKEKGK